MNGIEKITGRILDDAQAQADEIISQAQAEAAQIRAQYQAQAEKEFADTTRRGTERATEREENLVGAAHLEARKQTLAAKQAMVDKAFLRAHDSLRALSGQEYIAFLANLAANAAHSGTEELILSAEDKAQHGETVLAAANEALKAKGLSAALTLAADPRPTGGGLILRDGLTETNCTLETLLRLTRGELSSQVAEALFS